MSLEDHLKSYSEKQAAKLLNVSHVTMRIWRYEDTPGRPPHYRLAGAAGKGSVRYRAIDLMRYQEERMNK
tara:strand:- start:151 stop:360 length:210 start_codon:yes stop_codon:yes gene_type:complete